MIVDLFDSLPLEKTLIFPNVYSQSQFLTKTINTTITYSYKNFYINNMNVLCYVLLQLTFLNKMILIKTSTSEESHTCHYWYLSTVCLQWVSWCINYVYCGGSRVSHKIGFYRLTIL